MKLLSGWLALAVVLAVSAFATDGTMWIGAPSNTAEVRYQDGQYWDGYQVAGDGGVATFAGYSFANVLLPSGLVLGGLDFAAGFQASDSAAFKGMSGVDAITVSGDAFLAGSSLTGPRIDIQLRGTGGNTLVKKGAGQIRLVKNTSNLAALKVADGVLRQDAAVDGRVFGDATVRALEIAGGIAHYNPSTAGTSVRLPGTLVAGRGAGLLPIRNGATLTADTLSVVEGGALIITNSSGVAGLGTTEKLKFTTAPALVNGIVDPRVVTRDQTKKGGAFTFLTYDADKGLVPYPESSLVDISTATATDIAAVNPSEPAAAVAIDADAHVAGLVVNERAALKIAEGVTVAVGDGTHPAGVLFREQTDISSGVNDKYLQYDCAGTIDFGTSPGIIWKGAPSSATGRGLDIIGRIAGSAGVTFASRAVPGVVNSTTFIRFYTGCCGWTGPTYFYNCRAWIRGNSVFPDGGDVYICGRDTDSPASLSAEGTYQYSQHFHLSGTLGNDGTAGLQVVGTSVFNGPLTIDGRLHVALAGTMDVNGAVDGPGEIVVKHVAGKTSSDTLSFNGSVSGYAGRLTLDDPSLTCHFADAIPTNAITVAAGTLLFTNRTNYALATKVGGAGKLRVDQSTFDIVGPQDFSGTFVMDANTNTNLCSVVGVEGNVRLGCFSTENGGGTGVICGRSADATLRTGVDGASFVVKPVLADGTGRLSFVKEGDGTVTLVGTNTYTGKTEVRAGTLRLQGNILESPSISWWLDASRPETIDCDADGNVTNWLSRVNGVAFGKVSATLPKYTTNADGLPVVNFPVDGPCGLATATNVTQRTVFIVYRLDRSQPIGTDSDRFYTLFGRKGTDTGIRTGGGGKWERNISTSKFNTMGYVYHDGVKQTANFAATETGLGILTLQHDIDWLKGESSVPAAVPSSFQAEIGGYNNSSSRRWVGDVAEAIAFDRLLTDAERQTVENYLGEKWKGAAFHAAVAQEQTLSPRTDVELAYGATLDLAGGDQTVASLSGSGTIANSSTNPAVLTVAGDCSFAGTVRGNVKLVAAGGASNDLRLALRDEASLGLTGGTSTLVAYTNLPLRANLAYWLDASDAASVACNANGVVTNWASRAGVVPAFSWATSGLSNGHASSTTGPKEYTSAANGVNGLRTVHFTTNGQELVSRCAASVRTLFLVAANDKTSSMGTGGYWGKANLDRGIRCNASTKFETLMRVSYYLKNDLTRYNGTVRNLASESVVPGTTPFCFVIRLDDASHPASETHYGGSASVFNRNDILGCYCGVGNGNTNFKACEVIAYTNALSDAELLGVETYLMDKWGIAGHTLENVDGVFNGTGTLELSDGATVAGGVRLDDATLVVHVAPDGMVRTVSINGPLAIGTNARLVVDGYERAAKNARHTVLSVAGDVLGSFASTDPAASGGKWRLYVRDGTWYLSSDDGTRIVFR